MADAAAKADGEDKIIEVPCGTVVYDGDTGEFLTEVKEHGQRIVLLKGGRGGLGNWHFRTATNQTPRYAQPGEPCQEKNIILQLNSYQSFLLPNPRLLITLSQL